MVIDNDSDIVAEKKSKLRKIWKVLTIGVISSLIASLIFYFVITYHKEIWRIVRSAVEWFWGLITYSVALPIWALVLLVLLALFVIYFKVNYIKVKGTSIVDKVFYGYTEDRFFGALWRWELGTSGINVVAYCPDPNCDTMLLCRDYDSFSVFEPNEYDLFCETCGYTTKRESGNLYFLENKVKRQIDRKLRLIKKKLEIKLKEATDKEVKEVTR